ncbi:hypothetical protein KR074_007261 [Drosophila pseudoananassae]|nr:hypothetical protein KR074_007261 [Drosophila pseudoananassae]
MSFDADYLYALRLQEELDAEERNEPASSSANEDCDYQMALELQAELNRQEERARRHNAIKDASNKSRSVLRRQNDQDEDLRWVYPKPNSNTKPDPPKASPAKAAVPGRGIQAQHNDYLNQTQNLVHPEWELIDPTPDIYAMFIRFDEKFFQKRLGAVCLEWSKRMTTCAGICYQRSSRQFKEVTIRLSEPLLKLRPRKDLVETLLHEMIHAYCFVLNIREGNGGHGPNFKRIMGLINQTAGTNITVYHSFHDEVAVYRTHVWRCTGICQNHAPFQGWVRRSSNRAPGPYDQWWEKHQRDCGGTFQKVSGPENDKKSTTKEKTKKAEKPKQVPEKTGLDEWLGRKTVNPPGASTSAGLAKNLGSVGAAAPMLKGLAAAVPPTSYPGPSTAPFAGAGGSGASVNRGANIMSFGDLAKGTGPDKENERNRGAAMSGVGYQMGTSKESRHVIDVTGALTEATTSRLRERWMRRVEKNRRDLNQSCDSDDSTGSNSSAQKTPPPKRRRTIEKDEGNITWDSLDDDIKIGEVTIPVIDLLDSDDEDDKKVASPGAELQGSQEFMAQIKREVMLDESAKFSEDEIVFIDNEYDEELDKQKDQSMDAAAELADQSLIDDFFGEDTLLRDFKIQNDVQTVGSQNGGDASGEIVSCPICFEKLQRSQLGNHLEGCSIKVSVEPPSFKPKNVAGGSKGKKSSTAGGASTSKASTSSRASNTTTTNTRPSSEHASTSSGASATTTTNNRSSSGQETRKKLQEFGYTAEEVAALDFSDSAETSEARTSTFEELSPRHLRKRGLHKVTVQCPRCGGEFLGHQLEAHRGICPGMQRRQY